MDQFWMRCRFRTNINEPLPECPDSARQLNEIPVMRICPAGLYMSVSQECLNDVQMIPENCIEDRFPRTTLRDYFLRSTEMKSDDYCSKFLSWFSGEQLK